MKKLITTIALSILVVTITNAQIKKPTVKVNTNPIETNTNLQGVKVNDLSRLKTIEDFEKLKIPVQQITKEKLNAKPAQTWKISATRLYYAQLKLDYFYGLLSNNEFLMKGSNMIDNEPEIIDAIRRSPYPIDPAKLWNFPLGIKFRVSADVEYKLKLKVSNAGRGDIFVVKNESFISRISKSDRGDYYYVFTPDKSEEITLKFSSPFGRKSNRSSIKHWKPITFTEILIERQARE